jgi:hypothetical protein
MSMTFDEGNTTPSLSQCHCGKRAGETGANDCDIDLDGCHLVISCQLSVISHGCSAIYEPSSDN